MERLENWFYSLLIAAVIAILIVGGISVLQTKDRNEQMKKDSCQLIKEAPTGNKIYCGKACFKDEIRSIYNCKSGNVVIIE